jgi:hypothetical protein
MGFFFSELIQFNVSEGRERESRVELMGWKKKILFY